MRDDFDTVAANLRQLNSKYLQQLVLDIRSGYLPKYLCYEGEVCRRLEEVATATILERTVLK